MKKLLLPFLFTCIAIGANAQWGEEPMDEKPSIRDRMFFGGGFGLSFSSYYDYFSVSPIVGFKVTPKLATGVGFQYRYTKYKQFNPEFKTNDYGISPFIRYNIVGPLFVHAEYEYLNFEYSLSERISYGSFLAGGGFFQPLGRNAGLFALALYNFSYKTNTTRQPYNSPWVLRVGITAGF
jgi:hypothetical protein